MEQRTLWDHLLLLVSVNSKDSVESILQTLWRTRKTGVNDADRATICGMLQLESDSDLDPLLVCLRMLMRRCVYDEIGKEEIHGLFPEEVSPEIQTILTLLLQKFQNEWREDVLKEKVTLPRLKEMSRNTEGGNMESSDPVAFQNNVKFDLGEAELTFQEARDTSEAIPKSLPSTQAQISDAVDAHGP
ncbi:hypothetical protein SAY87_028334 [Trapa incisa]|uniref:Uncharacterized protein n=1 Tax=Trapa incisa TaxID=236973 RepID=A0AAN7QRY4_9MYRT|nr:hypothetical protein SAY87_028334 [Trapa incisa]